MSASALAIRGRGESHEPAASCGVLEAQSSRLSVTRLPAPARHLLARGQTLRRPIPQTLTSPCSKQFNVPFTQRDRNAYS